MSEDRSTVEAESAAIESAAETMLELQQDGTLDDLADAATAISLLAEAMDDEMVQSLMATGTTLAEAGDGLATDGTVRLSESVGANADELDATLSKLVELERDGTLDDLLEAATTVSLLAEAMDDEMITSVMTTAARLGEVADSAAQPDALRTIQTMMDALDEAGAAEEPEQVGLLGTMSKLRDPDVQTGMGFFFAFAGALGRQLDRRAEATRE
ncbi:MAG: DUF1641 domain-containing protein [Halodesulfurarchaeum sp.]